MIRWPDVGRSLIPLLVVVLVSGGLPGCSTTERLDGRPNILLIVADDIGVDRLGGYKEHPDAGATPTIDRLIENGLLFRNAYSNPNCSATRATILTGRYSFRTGIGQRLKKFGGPKGLSTDEITIPRMLGDGYTSLALGKWHLADRRQGTDHPRDCGFEHYAGSLFNLNGESYYDWTKTTDGSRQRTTKYATTDTVDDAIEQIRSVEQPWFLYVAFNAAHSPLEAPPANLHSSRLTKKTTANTPQFQRAVIEAMDAEMARLLAAAPDAIVIFVTDNGSNGNAVTAPFDRDRAKGTLYEGGINVPLVIAGPGIASGEIEALVNTTDIFATIAEVTGNAWQAEDSVSLLPYLEGRRDPLRQYAYAEVFLTEDGRRQQHAVAIRDQRYKLIRGEGHRDELYDLEADPWERDNLLETAPTPLQQEALSRLNESLTELRGKE